MKPYNKLKGSVKICLVSGAVCVATSLTVPALAHIYKGHPVHTNTTIPTSLEQVTSFEQADKLFDAKVKEYASDKLMSYDEISDLKNILDKKISFVKGDKDALASEQRNIWKRSWAVEEEIAAYGNKIRKLFSQKKYTHPFIEKTRTDLAEKVLSHYPGLVEKNTGLIYSADKEIKQGLAPILREMVVKIHEIHKKFYKDNNLELLTKQEKYTLSDLAAFYKVLHKERPQTICFNEEELKAKEVELVKQQKALGIELKKLHESNNRINALLEVLNKDDLDHFNILKFHFDAYLGAKRKIDDFKKDEKNLRKQVGVSVSYMNKHFPKEYSGLEGFLKDLGYEVKVERFENPVNMLCPWPWWINTLFGAVFPVFRNMLAANFVGRKLDEGDGVVSVLEPLAFSLALDGIHPFVYPIRLLGMPVLFEPIRRLTGARTLK